MRVSSFTGDCPRLISAPVSLAFDPPPRHAILGSLLVKGTITHLRGPEGAGKSELALTVAEAVARGHRALMWAALRPRRVLFVHADTPPPCVQQRLKTSSTNTIAPNLLFKPIASPSLLPELSRPRTGFDLIVHDGFATSQCPESSGQWRHLARAVRSWREHGLAVLVVSRGGAPALDGMIDVTIGLARPGAPSSHGPAFQHVQIETAVDPNRAFAEASMTNATRRGRWRVYTRDHADLMRISGLARAGFSTPEIARNIGIPESRVRHLQAAADRHASAWLPPHRSQSVAAQSSQARPAIRANSDTLAVTKVAPRRIAWPAISTS